MKQTEAVLQWVEKFVIANGLCPFAAHPWNAGTVKAELISGENLEACFYGALSRVQDFVGTPAEELETTLLVFPSHLNDFATFLDFVYTFEEALGETGADELIQLAHFHPDYQFEGVPFDDPGNKTNRSPFPVVQLLRVESVTRAVAAHPDVKSIPDRNVAYLRGLAGEA